MSDFLVASTTPVTYINDMYKTKHFMDMLKERDISPEWIERTLEDPDRTVDHEDGTRHYMKMIPEHDNRWLRIVVNINESGLKRSV